MSSINYVEVVRNTVNVPGIDNNDKAAITDPKLQEQIEAVKKDNAPGDPTGVASGNINESKDKEGRVIINTSGPLSSVYSRALLIAFGKKENDVEMTPTMSTESQANDALMAMAMDKAADMSTQAFLDSNPDNRIKFAIMTIHNNVKDVSTLNDAINELNKLSSNENIDETIVAMEGGVNKFTGLFDTICEERGIAMFYSRDRAINYVKARVC